MGLGARATGGGLECVLRDNRSDCDALRLENEVD